MSSPCSLQQQSCADRRGECHDDGWGIGWYPAHECYRVRSTRPAREDPRYGALAVSVVASTVLAHVRQASVGALTEHNTHPFMHGPWMFAHNGTLHGFARDPERLRRLIDTGGFAKKDRITHRIPISSLQEVDDEVKRWLKVAYEMDA